MQTLFGKGSSFVGYTNIGSVQYV